MNTFYRILGLIMFGFYIFELFHVGSSNFSIIFLIWFFWCFINADRRDIDRKIDKLLKKLDENSK